MLTERPERLARPRCSGDGVVDFRNGSSAAAWQEARGAVLSEVGAQATRPPRGAAATARLEVRAWAMPRSAGVDPRRGHQEFENSVSVRESRWCAPCIIRAYAQKISEVKSYRVCCAASVSLKSEAWVESAWRHATGCTCTRAKQRVTVRSGRDVLLCCGGTARAIGPGRRRVRQGEIAPMQSATRPHAPLRCASRHSGPCGFARRLARAVFARAWSSPTAWEGTHGLARRSEGRHHRRCCDARRASGVRAARARIVSKHAVACR